jgi:hypothetical protein
MKRSDSLYRMRPIGLQTSRSLNCCSLVAISPVIARFPCVGFVLLKPRRVLFGVLNDARDSVNCNIMNVMLDPFRVRFSDFLFDAENPKEFEECTMPLLHRFR